MKSKEPKSRLNIAESKRLKKYIVDMENIIVEEQIMLPCDKQLIGIKTKIMAMAVGN